MNIPKKIKMLTKYNYTKSELLLKFKKDKDLKYKDINKIKETK